MQRKKGKSLYKIVFTIIVLFVIGSSCRPTRHLASDEYLLTSNKVEIDTKGIDKREIQSYFRQKPNRRMFSVFYFHLSAYNFSKRGKERKWKNWIGRVVGEEPAIFDSVLMDRTSSQFARYLKNEAYYNVNIESEVKLKRIRKRAKVIYHVTAGIPVIIRNVDYNILDTSISKYILADTASSLLQEGEKLRLEILELEREHIVNIMRDSGFYEFNPDRVRYIMDTSDNMANISIVVDYALKGGVGADVFKVPHKKFWIKDVFIYPDFNPQLNIRDQAEYVSSFDTIKQSGFYIIYPGKKNVKPKTILKANLVEPNTLYNQSLLEKSDKHMNSLRLFRLNNITFQKDQNADSLMNCKIKLTPFTYQNYSVNLETTNTQGNIGLGGYLNYQHRNLFKGAEIFNIKLSGSYERQGAAEELEAQNVWEIGAETRLETPAFILPFRMERFYNKYFPKTSFLINFSRQQKPREYTRNLFSVNMGYNWNGTKDIRHYFFPLDISVLTLPDINSEFTDKISGTHLENSFKPYFILGPRYVITKSNANLKNYNNYSYVRWSVQAAGNLAHLINENTNYRDTVTGGYYEFLNTQYAQFFKTDIDYRFYNYLSPRNYLVYRVFAGVVIPYGNAEAVPFVRQYYGGGAEGMRAWLARDLGPGTFRVPDSIASEFYPNMYGDVKLEANIEYRYEITKALKGAYFIDIGNIWTINPEDERPGGEFDFETFYKQLAIGSGFGIRYDFGFTVIRLDAAVKVRDPSIDGRGTWVLFNTSFGLKDIQWNFGIGYPF